MKSFAPSRARNRARIDRPPAFAGLRRGRQAGSYSFLLLLLLLHLSTRPLHAQVGNDNPAGASGSFNGLAGGCGYDPYTANATRSITDIAVAGAVGDYPLALVRTANSRAPSTTEVFGWSGGWNHNYNWILENSPSSNQANFQPSRYTVDFPDGRVETFKAVTWDPGYCRVRPGADTPAASTSAGVHERLQPHPGGGGYAYVILPDGGKIQFQAVQHTVNGTYYYKYTATEIIDPHGLVTSLTWETTGNGTSRLVSVTEPSGLRNLHFYYVTTNGPRIDHVTGSDGRTVQYYYIWCNGCTLDHVVYYGNSNWTAHYQYCNANLPGDLPFLLWTADDPMYAGPMKRIAYDYKPATPTNSDGTAPVYGQILRERYWDGVSGHETSGAIVSTLTVGYPNNNPVYRTETRGNGTTRTFIYNGAGAGYLAWISDFMGHSAQQHYDQSTKYIDYVVDRNGHRTDYTRDQITGNVTQVKYPLTQGDTPGQSQQPTANYTYTNNYYLHTFQDEGNHTTTITRDGNNRVTRIDCPDSGYETFGYDAAHFYQLSSHRMTTGGTETWAYDGSNRLQYYSDPYHSNPGNPSIQYFYEGHNWVNGIFDAAGNPTNWTYNDRGQVLVTTLAIDPVDNTRHTITNAYNPDGTLQSRTDQLGHVSSYAYDDYRRLTTVTTPVRGYGDINAHTTSYLYYDPFGSPPLRVNYTDTNAEPSFVFLPSGKAIWNVYDENWRKWWTTVGWNSGEDATTFYTYDNVGNLTTVTNPLNHNNVTTAYDERNRPSSVSVGGQTSTFTYDTAGRRKTVTRPNNQLITNFSFDNMNRVTRQDATNSPGATATTQYTYYPGSGLLNTMKDPHNATETYSYTYDSMGRQYDVTYPLDSLTPAARRVESYRYDTAGRLQTFKNRNGKTQTFTYDALNRVTGFSWDDNGTTPSVSFGYDAASRLTSVTNANATISRGYFNDNLLRTETETATGGVSRTVNYTYDADGNRATLQIPGYSFTYDYTGRNQLLDIKQNATALATYAYDLRGNITSRTVNTSPSTHSDYSSYDTLDRVGSVVHYLNGTTRTVNYGYASNSNDRLWAKRVINPQSSENNKGELFRYDLADQATTVKLDITNPDSTPAPAPSIVYDTNGNRTSFGAYGSTDTYTTNFLNQYTQRNASNAQYDKNGNLTTGFDGSTYQYDAQNRLLTASKSGGVTMNFTYDGLNRQISRTPSNTNVTTYSVWDGWNLVQEYHGNGTVDASYLYGATGLVKDLTANRYYYQDGSGSTSHLADASGNLLEWYRYDLQGTPFFYAPNDTPLSASNYSVRHLFTGQQWYSQIGLYDLRNRFYSPDIGRFLQADPIGFRGDRTNLYRYCGNNPVTRWDPLGLNYPTASERGDTVEFPPMFVNGESPNTIWRVGPGGWGDPGGPGGGGELGGPHSRSDNPEQAAELDRINQNLERLSDASSPSAPPSQNPANPTDVMDLGTGEEAFGGIEFSLGGIGVVTGAGEHLYAGSGYWLGADLHYHSSEWGGNGIRAAGRRATALRISRGFGVVGRVIFAGQLGLSAYQVYNNPTPGVIAHESVNTMMGAIGIFGGPWGFGISAGYFIIDATIGWDAAADYLILGP